MFLKMLKKIGGSKRGFTLTEVMIGIMILTVAIVSATNLLISLINTNANNVKTLQAYYLSLEGIEAVRNIRDTNWLLNENWLAEGGAGGLWGEGFSEVNSVNLKKSTVSGVAFDIDSSAGLKSFAPFEVSSSDGNIKFIDDSDSDFIRKIEVLPYECSEDSCDDYKLIRSTVTWDRGPEEGVVIEEILTNWKGGGL